MTESPTDLPGVDPDEFVGQPPTGEADPGGFSSGDQSSDEPADHQTDDPPDDPPDDPAEDDS